ncbi:MAG: hypothetical protein A2Z06_04595, partial [Candidatus Glassbacteria bacterium RBG_16_58_8]
LLGDLYIQKGEYLKADSAFDKAVSLNPKLEKEVTDARKAEWSNLVNRGVNAMESEDYEQAIGLLNHAALIYPEGVEAHLNLAASHVNASQKDEEWIREYVKAHGMEKPDDPESPPSSILLRESIRHFRKAIEIEPANADVKLDLARVYDFLGKPDSARVYYQDVLQLQPENRSVKEAMATCYVREENLECAHTIYYELMATGEVSPDVAFNIGVVELQLKDWESAEKAFELTVKGKPDDLEALENLSISLMEQKKYDKAIPHLEKIVTLNEKNQGAWGSLVVAYAQLGMNDKASQAHEKYQMLDRGE